MSQYISVIPYRRTKAVLLSAMRRALRCLALHCGDMQQTQLVPIVRHSGEGWAISAVSVINLKGSNEQ